MAGFSLLIQYLSRVNLVSLSLVLTRSISVCFMLLRNSTALKLSHSGNIFLSNCNVRPMLLPVLPTYCSWHFAHVIKGRYVFNWGDEPGLRRGGSLVKFLQIGEGQTSFVRSRGRVLLFSGRKKLLHVAFY